MGLGAIPAVPICQNPPRPRRAWVTIRPRHPVALGDGCVGRWDPSFLRLEVLAHRGLGRVFEDPALQNFRPGGIGAPPGTVTPRASTRRTVGPEFTRVRAIWRMPIPLPCTSMTVPTGVAEPAQVFGVNSDAASTGRSRPPACPLAGPGPRNGQRHSGPTGDSATCLPPWRGPPVRARRDARRQVSPYYIYEPVRFHPRAASLAEQLPPEPCPPRPAGGHAWPRAACRPGRPSPATTAPPPRVDSASQGVARVHRAGAAPCCAAVPARGRNDRLALNHPGRHRRRDRALAD